MTLPFFGCKQMEESWLISYPELFMDVFDPEVRLKNARGRYVLDNDIIPKYKHTKFIKLTTAILIPCNIYYLISELYSDYPIFIEKLIRRA